MKRLLKNAGIIRNQLKIEAAVSNARAFLAMREKHGSFAAYLWGFIGDRPIVNRRKTLKELPATSRESDAMSQAMKRDGFKFVGSTVLYAHMQATGMVNDHLVSCFRYKKC